MFDILFTTNWINSFMCCVFLQLILEKVGYNTNKANILTCILFQIFFVSNTMLLIYNQIVEGLIVTDESIGNTYLLYGYFVYDTIFLIIYENKIVFIIHHIISLIVIDTVILLDISDTALIHNISSLIAEITNPFLNCRIILKNNVALKRINYKIILWTYFVFRIILFPICCAVFIMKINYTSSNVPIEVNIVLIILLTGLYSMSIHWYRTISNKIS